MDKNEALYALVSPLLQEDCTLVDYCCGNGKLGALFDTNDQVRRIIFVDRRRVRDFAATLARVQKPVEVHVAGVEHFTLPNDGVAVAMHACGELADRVIEQAVSVRRLFAVVPCCYAVGLWNRYPEERKEVSQSAHQSRRAYCDALRACYATRRGYQVRTVQLERAITPMNTLLLGIPQ